MKKNKIILSHNSNFKKYENSLFLDEYVQKIFSGFNPRFEKNNFFISIENYKKKNFSFVVNLGGYVDHINKHKTYNSHYVGCKNLSDILSEKNLATFVQMGSGGEYGRGKSPHDEKIFSNPRSIYSKSKFLATKYLLALHRRKNFLLN